MTYSETPRHRMTTDKVSVHPTGMLSCLKKFGVHKSFFVAPLIPCLGLLVNVSSVFQSQSGQRRTSNKFPGMNL